MYEKIVFSIGILYCILCGIAVYIGYMLSQMHAAMEEYPKILHEIADNLIDIEAMLDIETILNNRRK